MSVNILPPPQDIIVTGAVVSASQLFRAYNMRNVDVFDATDNNKYTGKIDQVTQKDKELYKSTLGTPVVTDLTLKGGKYTDSSGKTITFKDIKLVVVLMNVSQGKKVVLTDIQGEDGTAKEYMGMDDYQISINGIFNGPNGHYPIDEVNALQQLNKAPIAITVVSRYLQNLDINEIYIKDFSYDQEAGGYSKQNFSIQALSDKPIEVLVV